MPLPDFARILRASQLRYGGFRARGVPAILLGVSDDRRSPPGPSRALAAPRRRWPKSLREATKLVAGAAHRPRRHAPAQRLTHTHGFARSSQASRTNIAAFERARAARGSRMRTAIVISIAIPACAWWCTTHAGCARGRRATTVAVDGRGEERARAITTARSPGSTIAARRVPLRRVEAVVRP